MKLRLRILPVCLLATAAFPADTGLFDKGNLAAWCIVPFDAGKRGPEERAAMLEKLGVRKFVYDYRAEHIAQWDDELNALKKHHIELLGWWFPTSLNDEARKTLDLFKRHGVKPQLWVNGNGGPIQVKDEADRKARIAREIERLQPIALAAAETGCQVGLYNHGSWYGEPENSIAIVEAMKSRGMRNVGIVYNLHHGHGHLDRLERVLPGMLPHILCFNLNGMDLDGEAKGRKILPLGAGSEDVKVLRILRASGYHGPVGILNHTNEDAEGRLLDNLDGLNWLLPQLDDKPPGPKPAYRTWSDRPASSQISNFQFQIGDARGAPSLSNEFGKALQGSVSYQDNEPFRTLPLTIECRAKLNSRDRYNILIASDVKASATHWELYTHAARGTLALFMPGRGGNYDSGVNICDGQWHDLLASIDDKSVILWVDGRQVLDKPVKPLTGIAKPGGIAFGRLVEGTLGCDGVIDDARISRGVMKPRKGGSPRLRMDNTLGLWNFDELNQSNLPAPPAPAAFTPERQPLHPGDNRHWQEFVNRDRVFDFYAKQARQFMKLKPPPALIPAFPGLDGGRLGHWGNQNDQVPWKDGRFAASDHGTVFSTAFKGGGMTIPKGVCVRFDDKAACFDPQTLSFPIIWSGGFIRLSDARHGFMGGGAMDGRVLAKPEDKFLKSGAVYHGFYRHGREVFFSYSAGSDHYLATARDGRQSHEKLAHFTKGGPAQWPEWLETKGVLGNEEPFATDTITIPFENPYGTLFFISGHDFFSDGTAAVATMTGEVWLVRGIDEKLGKLRWKRFATGLHQPLGVKIVQDQLYVLGRDQITRLHDLNGDAEADFHECVTNAMITSPGGHDFITGLERDEQGRFYFASGNQGVCRVTVAQASSLWVPTGVPTFDLKASAGTSDGQNSQGGRSALEVLATGFRNPNGLGLSPDGKFITTSVQEGDWTPASSVCQVEIGGNEGAHFGAGGPKNGRPPEPPMLYLPRGEDNSSGGQCFITGKEWSELQGDGNLIHFSSGSGSAFLTMRQQAGGRWQAAALKISGNFDSGSQAGRFRPGDGHLYVTGMQGWGSYTPKDGCFQRVRFTGGPTPVPVGFEARDNGVLLRFNRPLDQSAAADASRHFAQCWNYRYSAAYGSPEYSTRYFDSPGHDPLEIRSAQLLAGGKSLFLEIPQLVPASQIHLHVSVTRDRAHDLFLTAHALAPDFTDFPGYVRIAKAHAPAAPPATLTLPPPAKPNPWREGKSGRQMVIEAALGLQYAQKQITAKPGERLSLTFKNPDVVPHNWVLVRPGKFQAMGDIANRMITDPKALARHYVPESPDVLVYTDMVNPAANITIHFNAPTEPGEYPYLCTFPGHWMVMNGVLTVTR